MKKINALQQVAEFHNTFKHPILDSPQIPESKRAQLRVDLLQEELNELKVAIENGDLIEAADAFCDLQYVLSGAILEFGLGDRFVDLFDEVHRSNMSKVCLTFEDPLATQDYYLQKDGTESVVEQDGQYFLVYRKSDGKTLKSIKYSPADFRSLL